jgi:hypothetical protein
MRSGIGELARVQEVTAALEQREGGVTAESAGLTRVG